jgi:pSer/pThr/pTyr-binding forkhead associated (FHA) protein
MADDLQIQIAPAAREKKGLFGPPKAKEEKPPKEQKARPIKEKAVNDKAPREKTPLFGKKKAPEPQQDIMQGAAASPGFSRQAGAMGPAPMQQQQQYAQQQYAPQPEPYYPSAPGSDGGLTEIEPQGSSAPRLRYVGSEGHPRVIEVAVAANGIFSIGRFDASVGKKQSDFEFDKATKAVSRRHAVVERGAGGYSLIDLSSSAGTFVNGQKIPPNVPCPLESGSRVSFGNAGADYIWEN